MDKVDAVLSRMSPSDRWVLIDPVIEVARQLEKENTLLRDALVKAKPIVGAAVAGSSNAARPIRQKVYEQIEIALKGLA